MPTSTTTPTRHALRQPAYQGTAQQPGPLPTCRGSWPSSKLLRRPVAKGVTGQTTRTRNDHDTEQIFGAAIDPNTYPIRRDSYSAIWPVGDWVTQLAGYLCWQCQNN